MRDPSRLEGYYDEAAETRPREEIRSLQEGLLSSIVPYCYRGSSTYRAKLDEAGLKPEDVRTLGDLARVPVTHKAETMGELGEGFMTVPYEEARRIFVSPGPQFHAYGEIPQAMNPMLKVFHAVGFRPNDIVLNTFTYHLTPAGIMFDEAISAFGCAVIPAGTGNTDLQVQVLRDLDVTGYLGTPSFLAIILERAHELGVDPASEWSLAAALTSAETLTEGRRAALEGATGAMVRQLYGSADGLLPCYECWAADGMHVPELMILEITDPESGDPVPDGEPGAVTATVYNPYRPLLRFANGDRGMLEPEPCRCGRTAQRFRFLGRIDEARKVRGMFVYPEQIAEAMQRDGVLPVWRAVVEHDEKQLDRLTVEVEGSLDDAMRERLTDRLRRVVRVRPEVVAVPAGTLGEDAGRLVDLRS
jgi:phenylacetate-coenzyme A ligase PaaK-like adenylate-forming protein